MIMNDLIQKLGLLVLVSVLVHADDAVQDLGATLVVAPLLGSKANELDSQRVIQDEALLRRQAGSLAETLRDVPGLSIRSMGPAPARPVLFGLGGDHVTVTEDGQRTGDLSATSPDHAVAIEPLSMDRVEVIQGPRLLARSGSVAGGLVRIDRQEIPMDLQKLNIQQISSFESSAQTWASATSIGLPLGEVKLRGEWTRRGADQAYTPLGPLLNTELFAQGASLGLAYGKGAWDFGVSARLYQSDYGILGGFVGAHPKGVDIEMDRQAANARVRYASGSDTVISELHHSYYHHVELESSGLVGAEFVTRSDGARVEWNREKWSNRYALWTGVEVYRRSLEMGGFVFTPPTQSLELASWGIWAWRPRIRGLELQAAVRLAYVTMDPQESLFTRDSAIHAREFPLLAWSILALKQIATGQYLELQLYRSSRSPSIEELYNQGPHLAAYTYELGSPQLPAEVGHGGKLSWKISRGEWRGHASLYGTDFGRFLAPRATGDTNWSQLLPIYQVSAVHGRLMGIEGQLACEPENGFGLLLNFGAVWGAMGSTWAPMPQIPPMKLNSEWSWSHKAMRWSLFCELAATQNRVDQYEEATKSYGIWGFGWEWQLPMQWSSHSVLIRVNNASNEVYRNHLSRLKSIMPEQGRSIQVLWRVGI